ncbi:DUF5677 domain-containing protein [Brenneria izbisi]|uniref:DUF5677 domain-containing protein n=1 Tax=Brenneria izbisi TaxID=2939450 RepID=A0AA42C166_9GAMM|nr:DUF5677 domain-containing protein [Brenneria izbisi]MCV9878272.1 DUF5677 domain-containing protein [Brenneria izbisi]MCV9881695.1 DUF5677 domain-containing protein [Brenneria izbisi]
MPVSKNKRKNKSSKSGKNRTPLLDHKKIGSELHPAFSQLKTSLGEKMIFSSWSNERLPEMLWAAIIRVINEQDYAISEFRRVISFVSKHPDKEKMSDLSLTGISKLDDSLRDEFLCYLLSKPITASALTVLLIFKGLPARESWLKFLPDEEPNLDLLMVAVGMCFPHQSQEATDCRWLKVMLQIVSGKLHVPKEMIESWITYPYEGDLRIIRPSIRSCEMTCNPMMGQDLAWAKEFWDSAWRNTPCLDLIRESETSDAVPCCSLVDISTIQNKLEKHWIDTHSTTEIDAKHDGTFGIAFYTLTILSEIVSSNIRTGILARLGLRTILESHINLRYLALKDDKELWSKWRTYGAGQAKLNALKFDELVDPPRFINSEILESIAGEDLWEEFINIELGSWSGADLRKLSASTGLKSVYDQYYSWSSTYSHGTWGAIREVCFNTCGNPLHRLHRYPKESSLPDTLYDACVLVDEILNDLSKLYPSFSPRLLEK